MSTAIVRSKENLAALLSQENVVSQIRPILPKHLTIDRLVKCVLLAAARQPKLLECTTTSIVRAVMTAAELGLEPTGTLGHGYIVPYGTEATLIPGYRGLITLARRSGMMKKIEARVVYAEDVFDVELGLDSKLVHKPNFDADPSDANIRFVYAVAELVDGSTQFEVMTRKQVDGIRNRSKAARNGPWVTDYAEMARKTVVRRLCKYLPLSVEMVKALELVDEHEGLAETVDVQARVIEPGENRTEQVKAVLKSRKKAERPAPEEDGPPPPTDADIPAEYADDMPVEEPPAGAQGEQTEEVTRQEALAIMLSEAQDCTLAEAREALDRFAGNVFKKKLAELSPKSLDGVEVRIKDGSIRVAAKAGA